MIQAANSSDLVNLIEDQEIQLFNHLSDGFMDTLNTNSINEVMSIFGTLLNGLPVNYIVDNLGEHLMNGLKSSNESINEVWLKTLVKMVNNQNSLQQLINRSDSDFIAQVIKLQSVGSVSNSKLSTNIIVDIVKNGYVDSILSPSNVQQLIQLMAVSDIVKMRILSLVVTICTINDVSLNKIVNLDIGAQIIPGHHHQ